VNPAKQPAASNELRADTPRASRKAAMPNNKKLKPAIAIAAVVAILAGVLGLRTSLADKEGPKKPEDAPRTFELAAGDVSELRREALGRSIPVSGSMRPVLQATVRSKVAAEVARIHVQEGERIAVGAPIATLDTGDLKARHDAQAALVAEMRAKVELAKKNQANSRALLDKSFISQNAFDSVDNALQVAQANLQSAEAQAAITLRAVNDAQIRAPFDGIVAKRFVNVGDKLSTDMPVVLVVDLTRMEMEAPIPVGEIPYVKVGQEIAFTVDGFQGRAFTGKVERVNPSAEAGSRSISVFVTLPNADGALKGGMFASGVLATRSGAEVDVIPLTAVLEEGGQTFVHVVRNGKVERRSVILGARNAERGVVTVREGLERNVPVIIVKAEGLKPGASAVVRGKAPKTST
jgi:RND family efflux transporter MFP subunit